MRTILMAVAAITLASCVDMPDNATVCRGLASSEDGFWHCMDYQQRETARLDGIWERTMSQQTPNPLIYMPQRQTIRCYSDGIGTMTCR